MTKFSSRLSQISLALVVAFGAVNFTACGADESKAPQIARDGAYFYAVSQDDDTILKGATVSGRNGKCEKQTVKTVEGLWYKFLKDMETCKKDRDEKKCDPIFDGQKLVFGEKQLIYSLAFGNGDKCPPKNGVWKIELETNFGTYVYELD